MKMAKFGSISQVLNNFEDLSNLTLTEKEFIIKLCPNSRDAKLLLEKGFSMEGLVFSNINVNQIPLVLLEDKQEYCENFYTFLGYNDRKSLFVLILDQKINPTVKMLKYILVETDVALKYWPEILKLDEEYRLFDDKSFVKNLTRRIICHCNTAEYNYMIEYLMHLVDPKDWNMLLAVAIYKMKYHPVEKILEFTQDPVDCFDTWNDFNLNVMHLLYQKIPDQEKLTDFLLKLYVKYMNGPDGTDEYVGDIDILSIHALYEKALESFTMEEIKKKISRPN